MNMEAVVAWGDTECSLAGSKGGDVTRANHCSFSDFTLIDCLPLRFHTIFGRQQTDFGKEHTLSTSYKALDCLISPEPGRLLL